MGYKTELQANNADLQTILNKVNALPEAGGGGGGASVETCTVTIVTDTPQTDRTIYYTNAENVIITQSVTGRQLMNGVTLTILKNTILFCWTGLGTVTITGDIQNLNGSAGFAINGDGRISIF